MQYTFARDYILNGVKENPDSALPPLIWTQPMPRRRSSPLEREDIVRAAVALADEGGADALTMAAVARRLGPYTPMALYRYVLSKDGLVDLMLDHVTGEIPLPRRPRGRRHGCGDAPAG